MTQNISGTTPLSGLAAKWPLRKSRLPRLSAHLVERRLQEGDGQERRYRQLSEPQGFDEPIHGCPFPVAAVRPDLTSPHTRHAGPHVAGEAVHRTLYFGNVRRHDVEHHVA